MLHFLFFAFTLRLMIFFFFIFLWSFCSSYIELQTSLKSMLSDSLGGNKDYNSSHTNENKCDSNNKSMVFMVFIPEVIIQLIS